MSLGLLFSACVEVGEGSGVGGGGGGGDELIVSMCECTK